MELMNVNIPPKPIIDSVVTDDKICKGYNNDDYRVFGMN